MSEEAIEIGGGDDDVTVSSWLALALASRDIPFFPASAMACEVATAPPRYM